MGGEGGVEMGYKNPSQNPTVGKNHWYEYGWDYSASQRYNYSFKHATFCLIFAFRQIHYTFDFGWKIRKSRLSIKEGLNGD